ncbi:hypothetical protein H8356DRAFT_1284179 [Neocallimastix lanati (nom. inval.)]|nr:hypothetical protein H8356DRAFT_1284179 [Neocallimastix sp. JGI-2020a]
MAESKLKRVTENENQDFTVEPPNKKRKESSNLLKKFKCKYFYIDKSLLIKEFLQDDSEIVCVTRPSGFGKTTNLTMLRYFFEMSYENIKENEFQNLQNKKYFENLLISKEKEDDQTYLDKYQGKYPVIYLDFNSVFIKETYEATIENFKTFISNFGIFSISELKQSISFLCLSLNKVFNKKIILLIDNYDSPILNTVNTSFYNKFYKFYDEVFLEIFKQDEDNCYLFKTFITRNLKKDYIEKHREIFWTLLVEYGYLIYDYRTVTTISDFKVVKLKVSTNDVREFIKKKFFEWKKNLFNVEKIKNTIDSLTRNYDEERIIEFLKDKIKSNLGYSTGYDYYKNEFLDKYYSIIYSLLSLSDECEVVTKEIFNENNDIRELLIIPKKNLKSNNNKNDIIYIIIKMQKKIYTGEEFQYASNKNFYLIDKTKMISKIINHEEIIAYLITQPRRFGKSLNLSMIKEFFEKPINEIENEDKKFVFDGLEVSKDRKNMRHFYKYPVIYLNFKGIQGNNFEEIKNFLIDIISTLFKNMRNKIEFEKLDDLDKRDWNEIENKNKNNIKLLINSLSFMCSCLRKFYKRRYIILIDEYDQVLINSIKKKVFDIVQPIIERIFSCAFKGNDNLYFGVITGCYHFGLNSSNSGAYNFTKCSLLKDNYFSDCYGFTEDELKNILSNFNITDSKEKSDDIEDGIKERLKKKYGGYSCVSNIGIIKNIYNPYSVMKFVQKNKNKRDNFELSNYWNYPEKNEKLKNFLKNSLAVEQESGHGIIDIGFPHEKYGMAFFRKKCLIEMKVNDENIKEYEDNEDDNKI